MTKEQAIKLLRKELSADERYSLTKFGLRSAEIQELIQEAMDEGADAIEKQIAKKPKVIIHDEDVRIGRIKYKKGVKTYKCVCESWITFLQDYCSCCGQKLDWSEVE